MYSMTSLFVKWSPDSKAFINKIKKTFYKWVFSLKTVFFLGAMYIVQYDHSLFVK